MPAKKKRVRKPQPFSVRGLYVATCETEGKHRFIWAVPRLRIHIPDMKTWTQGDFTRYALWLPKAIAWRDAKKDVKCGR